MSKLSFRIIKNTNFPELYKKLLLREQMSYKEKEKILKLAIIFINLENENLNKFGYRLIVMYCNQYNDYLPLYEVSLNKDLYPISHFIERNYITDGLENFYTIFNSSLLEQYKKDNVYQSLEQYNLNNFYNENKEESVSVVAPTSYGKTELIIDTIRKNINKRICIITPTKSLLAQTKQRIVKANISGVKNIIIHPEMFKENDKCVAVLTQERVMNILKEYKRFYFDIVIVDEAHEILSKEDRSQLLASAILVLYKRNKNTSFKFLTPFMQDSSNLKVRYSTYDLKTYRINEYIKTERIYLYDIKKKNGLKIYDQFLNEWFPVDNNRQDAIDFLLSHMGEKNIIYFNKPRNIESFAKELISKLPDIQLTDKIKKAINNISSYLNEHYTLIKCLKKGIIYHHGSIPDAIRQYIEYLYSSCEEIKFVICSSTLLEGVNLPAEKMFIFDYMKGGVKLTPSNFKNLIGRVCRFNEIFNSKDGNLKKLEPEIYVICDKYFPENGNPVKFIENVMKIEKDIYDECENVLLENTEINDKNISKYEAAMEFTENYEKGTISGYNKRVVTTHIGNLCIQNNVVEFDVFQNERSLQMLVEIMIKDGIKINSTELLLDIIYTLFISKIDFNEYENMKRFQNQLARNYYMLFLNQKIENESYSMMINKTVAYWNSLIKNKKDTLIYVGSRWGEKIRGFGHRKLWLDIKDKTSNSDKVNLAIVRIKEEQDFIDNAIMKYVEILKELNLIDKSLYLKLKYGTDNEKIIVLIRNGISLSLANLLIEQYSDFIEIDVIDNSFIIDKNIIDLMKINKENEILIFEITNNVYLN